MTDRVAIFAPSPQLTVTVEEVDGRPDVHLHAGGQGFWQARMITALGSPVTLVSAFGGETGQVLRHLVQGPDIELRAREVNARNGAYVHDRRDGDRETVAEMMPRLAVPARAGRSVTSWPWSPPWRRGSPCSVVRRCRRRTWCRSTSTRD